MKKTLISILGAVAVFAGCTKENENYGFIVPEGKELVKITAMAEASRTTVDINDLGANYAWNFSDTLAVVEEDAEYPSKFTLVDAATGTFAGVKTEGKSLVFAITPESLVTSGVDVGGELQEFSVYLPDFYEGYVPGTTNALMVGTPAETTDNGYRFYFRHATALIKVRYENVPKGTAGLCLTTDKVITGNWTFDSLDDVVLTESEQGSNSVWMMLEKPVSLPNQPLDFYVPVPVGDYSSLSIMLLDENLEEFPETVRSKQSNFSLGRGDLFTTPVVTLPEESLEGSYIIVSNPGALGKWVVMQAAVNGSGRWLYDESEHAYTEEVNLDDSSVDFAAFSNIAYKFDVIALETGGYVLRNAQSGEYVQYAGTGNAGKEVSEDEKTAFNVFKVNADASWTIGSFVGEEYTYALQCNSSTNNKFFTFYKIPGNQKPIYLIPYVGAATPVKLSGSCSKNTVTLTANPAEAEIRFTTDGSEPDLNATPYEGPFSISASCTVKAIAYAPNSDYTDSDIFELECTYVEPGTGTYYEKVTTAPTDWTGDYLIVYEADEAKVLTGVSSNNVGTVGDVIIEDDSIEATEEVMAYNVVIATSTAGYTMKLGDIYLAYTSTSTKSNNYLYGVSDASTNGTQWILSVNDAQNVYNNNRYLRYNSSSPRFCCYTSGQQNISFYKLSDSRQKLPTPEGLQMEEDFTVSWTPVDGAASYNVVIGTLHDNTTESSYTFEGEAGYYNVSVIAVSGDGQYADSDPAILENAKFGTPTLPAPELSKGACTGTSVQVTWTADERATNGYQATLYVPGAPALDSQVVTEGSVTFDGLNAGTTYTVQVYALAVEEGEFPYAESEVSSIEVSTTQGGDATIADMIAACPSDSYSLTGVTVVGVPSTSNALIGDGTGFALVYKTNHGLSLGDVINVSGATKRWDGVVEFNKPAIEKTGTATTIEYGDPVDATAELLEPFSTGDFDITYIRATGVQSGQIITLDNGYTFKMHTSNAATNGKTVTVSGLIYGYYNNNFNLFFTSIEEDASAPSLEVTPLSKTWAYNETTAADFKVTALNGTWDYAITSPSLSWASIERTNTGLTITPKGENSGDYDYSGTVTVTLTPSNGGDELTKDIVLTQKKNSSSGGTPDPETITFADLGLENGVQYSDPFDGGNFTITFGGGGNDGKYYTTGAGIRTYGDGTITVASNYKIAKIEFTWDGSNAPTDDVANPSGYSTATKAWTGSANSIVLTRPSGSGHWRLKAVKVTYED